MYSRIFPFLTTAILLGLVSTLPADAAKKGDIYAGCTETYLNCTALRTLDGQLYNVSSAMPAMPVGKGITALGEKVGDVGTCFLPTLRVTSWSRNRLHCPIKPK